MPTSGDGWYNFDDGKTIGQIGSEEGLILCDEEHKDGIRITLEHEGHNARYSITCGVYGRLLHTCFFSNETEGVNAYDEMKPALVTIANLEREASWQASDEFVRRFA